MAARAKIGDLLVDSGAITKEQLEAALAAQDESRRPLGMTLVRLGFLDEDTLIRTLALQLKMPVVKLTGKLVNQEVLDRVPGDLAEKYRCIPLLLNDEGGAQVLYLGMEDPADADALAEIRACIGDAVKPVLVAPTELDEALHRHYHWASSGSSSEPLYDAYEPVFGEPSGSEAVPEEFPIDSPSPAPAPAPAPDPGAVEPPPILRALAQLLVEKGVITREELVARVDEMAREEQGAR